MNWWRHSKVHLLVVGMLECCGLTVEGSRTVIHCDVKTPAAVFILNGIFQCKEPPLLWFLRLIAVTNKRICFVWLLGYPDYQYTLYTDVDDR